MNTSLKVQNYLKVLIPLIFLIANQTMAQHSKKSLAQYTGIWFGFQKQSIDQMQKRAMLYHSWRVHRIDTLKNEIEITQMGNSFDDGLEIAEPKKLIYKMTRDTAGFSVLLDGHQPNSRYKLSLSPLPAEEVIMLSGIFERLDKKTENKIMVFGKISDDTSDYVKPEGKVEVVVQPPPPIK